MPDQHADEERIFHVAREISNVDVRKEYLGDACGDDQLLRERVEALLAVHDDEKSFLKTDPALEPAVDNSWNPKPGETIGPYKILQKIGEGGMGIVYMAEQEDPVKRKVALKITKAGMDTRRVMARFEAERQALALMEHPNIATVLDGGTTESGRPFFVMELVKGIPITRYADENHLTPRQRLELFVPVCHAVQHAHQKGVIHRDIKPSNVLVAEYDSHAIPKVIDFGLAKAIGCSLTDKTLFTEFGELLGTLHYMSPEQAKFNQLDVDTRSDVYSLGVLLYELLTGETPFDRARLKRAAFDEVLRIIREEEPPKPSIRLKDSASLPTIAANRHVEPKKLGSFVKGDLDVVVLKALEKERKRRYVTPLGLADDVERFLDSEPVEARPSSGFYRIRKAYQRNRLVALSGMIIAATLILAAIISVDRAIKESRARKITEIQRGELAEALENKEQALSEAKIARAAAEEARDSERDERLRSEKLTRYNLSQRFAFDSRSVREDNPQRALLLAAEAVDICLRRDLEPTQAALDSIRDLMNPGRIGSTPSLVTSPDRRWMIRQYGSSGIGRRHSSNHFELLHRDGQEFRLVESCAARYRPLVAFSSDNRWAAATLESDAIRVWDLRRRGVARDLMIPTPLSEYATGSRICIPEETDRLVFVRERGSTIVFDLGEPNSQPVTLGPSTGYISQQRFVSPDCRWLIASERNGISLHDLTRDDPFTPLIKLPRSRLSSSGSTFLTSTRFLAVDSGQNASIIEMPTTADPDEIQDHQLAIPNDTLKRSRFFWSSVLPSKSGRWLLYAGSAGQNAHEPTLINTETSEFAQLKLDSPIAERKALGESRMHYRSNYSSLTGSGTFAFSSNERWLAVASVDNRIHVWDLLDLSNTTPKFVTEPMERLECFQLTDSHLLAAAGVLPGEDYTVGDTLIWTLDEKLSEPDRLNAAQYGHPFFLNDNELMVLGQVWKYGEQPMPTKDSVEAQGLVNKEQGWMLFSSQRVQKIRWIDSANEYTVPWATHDENRSAAESQDQRFVAEISATGEVHLYDFSNEDPVQNALLVGTTTSENARLSFSAGNDILLQSPWELQVWNSPDYRMRRIPMPRDDLQRSILGYAANWMLVGANTESDYQNRKYELWDLRPASAEEERVQVIATRTDAKSSDVRLSNDGRYLVERMPDEFVRLFDLSSGFSGMPIATFDGVFRQTAISGDSRWLAMRDDDDGLFFVDMNQPDRPQRLTVEGTKIKALWFSPQGSTLAARSEDGKVHLFRFRDAQAPIKQTLEAPDKPINNVTISFDDKYLAIFSGDGDLRCLDVSDLSEPRVVLDYHSEAPFALLESSKRNHRPRFDGRSQRLAIHGGSPSTSSFTLFWDLTAPNPESTLRQLDERLYRPIYSRDFETIYSVEHGKGLVKHTRTPSEWVATARKMAGRDLRGDEREQYLVLQE